MDSKRVATVYFLRTLGAGTIRDGSKREPCKIIAGGKIEINGKTYRKFEIPSFRTQTCPSAIPVDFRITPEFQDGTALYVMAVWDGGAQTPRKTVLHKIASLPKLNGLKTLCVGLGVSSYPENWEVGNYAKIGGNFVEFWEYLPSVMLGTHLGNSAYAARIDDAKRKGLNTMLELDTPFPRPGDVANGNMLKEETGMRTMLLMAAVAFLAAEATGTDDSQWHRIASDQGGKMTVWVMTSGLNNPQRKTLELEVAPAEIKKAAVAWKNRSRYKELLLLPEGADFRNGLSLKMQYPAQGHLLLTEEQELCRFLPARPPFSPAIPMRKDIWRNSGKLWKYVVATGSGAGGSAWNHRNGTMH